MTFRSVGVTLVELMVVLAVLGVMTGVAALAWRPSRPEAAGVGQHATESVAAVRRRAVESGRVVTAIVGVDEQHATVVAFPDGRVVGAEYLGVNPLTGEESHADTPTP